MNTSPAASVCSHPPGADSARLRRRAAVAGALALALLAGASVRAQPYPNSSPSIEQDPALGIATVRLWDGPAPGAKGTKGEDVPTLTIFSPQPGRGTGSAVIVAPGGAYRGLAANLEGRQVADWFTVRGFTAFVLKYRLGERYLYPVPLEDAQRAVRWVRAHAREYFVAPDRIGMIGFSAGGHLTAMTGTSFDDGNPGATDPVDRVSSRPDFLVLGYAWLDAMQPAKPKFIPSYETLMHVPESEAAGLAQKYTPTLHVTNHTPPTFLYSTTEDATVPVEASVDFYRALVAAGVPAEMHLFGHGGHGSGMGAADPALDRWPGLLEEWLRARGLLTADPAVATAIKEAREAQRRK
ncbi:MAG TPA: alpha/beta hydrolase [Opitutaceae bacterium]|nr:alpha/beta hydrolase [Opitutaceae bacterium]